MKKFIFYIIILVTINKICPSEYFPWSDNDFNAIIEQAYIDYQKQSKEVISAPKTLDQDPYIPQTHEYIQKNIFYLNHIPNHSNLNTYSPDQKLAISNNQLTNSRKRKAEIELINTPKRHRVTQNISIANVVQLDEQPQEQKKIHGDQPAIISEQTIINPNYLNTQTLIPTSQITTDQPQTKITLEELKINIQNRLANHIDTCCEQQFSDMKNYTQHIKTHHNNNDMFACNNCNQTFSTPRILVEHARNTHTIKSLYACPLCKNNLSNLTALLRHYSSCAQINNPHKKNVTKK